MGGDNKLASVNFSNVSKTYDGKTSVVDNLNLEVREGEFLSMLGPSGSGKTTCLMMLAGFETATSGEIFLDGRPINRVAPQRRNIGMVFQNYALFPHMTVAENLAFPLKVRDVSKADITSKVKRALEMVELPHLGDRRPAQLSGGQQQRVAVARALVFDPKLVLMDEPLGALDKQLREQMQYEIKRIHERLGVTIVYVTHDQAEALTMSDTIAVFNFGKIQQLATPSEIYETPSNSFVAQFIGENNVLPGTVEMRDGDVCTVRLENGEAVSALSVTKAAVGGTTLLSLRPERIVVEPTLTDQVTAVKGEVVDQIYVGDHSRIQVRVFGKHEFVVKVQNASLRRTFNKGEAITLGWQANDCRALDPASGPSHGGVQ
ncbi:ABC transporter ATP-binding protein [Rhizobium sp. CNPSo 3968]|uniref:ABC transporter ATP-binding protein n=1 Tax=Rhizobium sp. CNPSo 3968 TaxID=3021408 RepID=UPI002549F784|nr:ABC transporter ATP-binding protein [Rhizobium sp. CNPSo 3968]MDK4717868.1 ABC transporter ATP-binding protein [Rhizobium sp. CNPSo 3968]